MAYAEIPFLQPEQVERLPKFAQKHIRDLELKLRGANAYIAELQATLKSEEVTDTIADPYAANMGRKSLYLPNGTEIEFNLEPSSRSRSIMAQITDRRLPNRRVLEIQGHSGLEVIMNSSNSFYIAFPERWGS